MNEQGVESVVVVDNGERIQNARWLPWMMLSVVLLICVIWGYVFRDYFVLQSNGQKHIGLLGDSFGAPNALFAGLAFACIFWTMLLQREELDLQRRELKLHRAEMEATRVEMRGQREQLHAQDQTLQKHKFETSFFQLLGLHSETVNSMVIHRQGQFLRQDCFIHLFERLTRAQAGTDSSKGRTELEVLRDAYDAVFVEYQQYIGHHFHHICNMVKFVDQSDDGEKPFYTDLIRARLSSAEMGLLFYHGLSDRGIDCKDLFEKYALFRDIPSEAIINEGHKVHYSASAFGESN